MEVNLTNDPEPFVFPPLFHGGCSLAQALRYSKAALVIQKTYRMLVVRQLFLMIRQATITIQAFSRGALARRGYRQVRI